MENARDPVIETPVLGEGLPGYYARPPGPGPFPALIVFMHAWGIDAFMQETCDWLVQAGYAALAPDLYHGVTYGPEQRDEALAAVADLDDTRAMAETGRALEWLGGRREVDAGRVGSIGYCMGGRLAFMAHGAHAQRLRASVCYYGGGIAPREDALGRPAVLHHVPAMRHPLLLLYGTEDASILPDEHARIAEKLSAERKRYVMDVFPGAGHAFLARGREGYSAEASAEAWERTLAFLGHHLG